MPVNDARVRRRDRIVRALAAAFVLLGLCASLGCGASTPTASTAPASVDPERRMPK